MTESMALKPVGYYCDHSDEPSGARTHEGWEWTDEGRVWQPQADIVSAHRRAEDEKRCPRAVPVYAVDAPALLAELAQTRTDKVIALLDRIGDWDDVAALVAGQDRRIGRLWFAWRHAVQRARECRAMWRSAAAERNALKIERDRLRDGVEHLTACLNEKDEETRRLYQEFDQSLLGARVTALEIDLHGIVRNLEDGAIDDALHTAKSALDGEEGQ